LDYKVGLKTKPKASPTDQDHRYPAQSGLPAGVDHQAG